MQIFYGTLYPRAIYLSSPTENGGGGDRLVSSPEMSKSKLIRNGVLAFGLQWTSPKKLP